MNRHLHTAEGIEPLGFEKDYLSSQNGNMKTTKTESEPSKRKKNHSSP